MNMKARSFPLLALIALLSLPAAAGLFGPKGDSVEEKREKVRAERDAILARLYAEHPEAKDEIKKAAGYGAFNNKNMNLFLLSTGHGYGLVVDNRSGKETFMAMGSLGGGVGMGAKDLSVVFIFKDASVMKEFVEKGWQFGGEADATAKAGDKGDAAALEGAVDTGANLFEIYQMTDTGIALQATVAGTKYWKDKKLN
jgi:lipid-binding SYLF domain-containing protein